MNTSVFHQVRENYAFARPGGAFDQASVITSKGVEIDVTTAPVSNWRHPGTSIASSSFSEGGKVRLYDR